MNPAALKTRAPFGDSRLRVEVFDRQTGHTVGTLQKDPGKAYRRAVSYRFTPNELGKERGLQSTGNMSSITRVFDAAKAAA